MQTAYEIRVSDNISALNVKGKKEGYVTVEAGSGKYRFYAK